MFPGLEWPRRVPSARRSKRASYHLLVSKPFEITSIFRGLDRLEPDRADPHNFAHLDFGPENRDLPRHIDLRRLVRGE